MPPLGRPVRARIMVHLPLASQPGLHHDVGIMMTRTQLSFDSEMLSRARRRAGELGVSLAEYVRRLVAADLGGPSPQASPEAVFDLGASARSDVARDKDAMIAEAIEAVHR
jgi:hypothetical protein